MIKEKFLTVAKEKNHLETVILQQSDMIKDLEKEKSELKLSLKILTESHRKMKEKLLDFDILRNMEVTEFKKKIENLITENKRLLSEKDRIFSNLARDQQNISVLDSQMSHSLLKEKEDLEVRLSSAIAELKQFRSQAEPDKESSPPDKRSASQSAAEDPREETPEAELLAAQLLEITLDRDETKAELYHARAEIDRLTTGKVRAEEELQQKIAEYSEEISGLRTDIDELTSAIESKIQYIDEVQTKVTALSEELMHKDSELHEQIPALLDKINSLSLSIDKKMEENSLFAKELFDLNVKISALNDEVIQKDELLIEIAEDYGKQKEAHGQALQSLQHENDRLSQGLEDFRTSSSEAKETSDTTRVERDLLERQAAELKARIDELASENAALIAAGAEKDTTVAHLQQELSRSRDLVQQTAAETGSEIAALREKVLILNQQLLEKNEMLTVLSSNQLREKERLSLREADLIRQTAALKDETNRLEEALTISEEQLVSSRSQIEETLQGRKLIETQLSEALEKLQELAEEQVRLTSLIQEKDRSAAQALAECEALREAGSHLTQKISRLEDAAAASGLSSPPVDAEKEQLLRNAREYQETFELLKKEIISLNRTIAEKERQIMQLSSERTAAASTSAEQDAIREQSKLTINGLENRLRDLQEKDRLSETEKQQLLESLNKQKIEMETLRRDKNRQISELNRDVSSHAEALADLRTKLQQNLRQNDSRTRELREAPETSGHMTQKETEALPVRLMAVKESAPRTGMRSFAYGLLAVLFIITIGAAFYAYNTGLLSSAGRITVQQTEPRKDLSYQQLFALLNRSTTDGRKFQATLIAEPLVLKSDDPADRSLYDFAHYLYFRINISSPGDGLDAHVADDPSSLILLFNGREEMRPLAGIRIKGVKTFYRKEVPVSIIFYCAFPVTAITADTSQLSLSLKKDGVSSPLTWDIRPLRENNLLP